MKHQSFPSQIPRRWALGRGVEAEGPRVPGPRILSRRSGGPRQWAAGGKGTEPGAIWRGGAQGGASTQGLSEREDWDGWVSPRGL